MKDGIYDSGKVGRAAYDAIKPSERANWSTIKELLKSPAHYKAALTEKKESTPAQELGSAVHLAALEPQRFLREVVKYEGRRAGKEWEAFSFANANKLILKADDFDTCWEMQRAVWANPDAAKLLDGLQTEVTCLWNQVVLGGPGGEMFSVPCKARLDGLGPNRIVELKTTKDASPTSRGFPAECARYFYSAQLCMQMDGVHAATGKALPCFIVAVEKEPPYASSVWEMTPHALEVGRGIYWQLLQRLNECRSHNEFPGWPGVHQLVLPEWADVTLNDVFPEEAA